MELGILGHNEATPHLAPTDYHLFRALKHISVATNLKDESDTTRWLKTQDKDFNHKGSLKSSFHPTIK